MNILGPDIDVPAWAKVPFQYYSQIDSGFGDPVRIMKSPGEGEVSDKNPSSVHLQLVPSFRRIRVQNAEGTEIGVIHPRPFGFGYSMRCAGDLVWTVSNRSLVLRRHALVFGNGRKWDVRTPFYWWLNISCTENAVARVLGKVGPYKWLWMLWVAPDEDSHDVLSAVAFMHRRWWRR
jgi:hypothetical protein